VFSFYQPDTDEWIKKITKCDVGNIMSKMNMKVIFNLKVEKDQMSIEYEELED
jgi:hypothetical protein